MQSAVFTGRVARQTNRLYVLRMIVKLAYSCFFAGMRDQFYRLLEQAWLIPYNDDGSITNAYSKNLELVKVIIC